MKFYEEIPNIITKSDLNNLDEIYNYNYLIYKLINTYEKNVIDCDTKKLLNNIKEIHKDHLIAIVNILN